MRAVWCLEQYPEGGSSWALPELIQHMVSHLMSDAQKVLARPTVAAAATAWRRNSIGAKGGGSSSAPPPKQPLMKREPLTKRVTSVAGQMYLDALAFVS